MGWDLVFFNIDWFVKNYPQAPVIPSIQFRVIDFDLFKQPFNKPITKYPQSKRIGIGNLCKQRKIEFFRQLAKFLYKYDQKGYSFHVFGMSITALPLLRKFEDLTFDSAKWDSRRRCINPDIETFSSTKVQRAVHFLRYLQRIYAALNPENKRN